jgi:hypothetical protein
MGEKKGVVELVERRSVSTFRHRCLACPFVPTSTPCLLLFTITIIFIMKHAISAHELCRGSTRSGHGCVHGASKINTDSCKNTTKKLYITKIKEER